MNARTQRARQIMAAKNHASQIGLDKFKVRSQTAIMKNARVNKPNILSQGRFSSKQL